MSKTKLKIPFLESHPDLPGANELMYQTYIYLRQLHHFLAPATFEAIHLLLSTDTTYDYLVYKAGHPFQFANFTSLAENYSSIMVLLPY